jgi:hypothetical protein
MRCTNAESSVVKMPHSGTENGLPRLRAFSKSVSRPAQGAVEFSE